MSYVAKRTEGRDGAPLFLTFHGTGGSEMQFHGFAEGLMPDGHVVSPRGNVSEMGAARYFRRTGEGVYDMVDLAHRTEAMAEFIAGEKDRTGAAWVAGLGYSNGANILAAVVLSYPDLVNDLVLMHPLIPWQPDPQPGLKGRRILVTAGERDPICPAPATQAFAEYLAAQGADTTVHWHSGGHEIAQSEVEAITGFLQPLAQSIWCSKRGLHRKGEALAAVGVADAQAFSMKHEPGVIPRRTGGIEWVAKDRMLDLAHVNAQLVRPTRFRIEPDARLTRTAPNHPPVGNGLATVFPVHTLPGSVWPIDSERQIDRAGIV